MQRTSQVTVDGGLGGGAHADEHTEDTPQPQRNPGGLRARGDGTPAYFSYQGDAAYNDKRAEDAQRADRHQRRFKEAGQVIN